MQLVDTGKGDPQVALVQEGVLRKAELTTHDTALDQHNVLAGHGAVPCVHGIPIAVEDRDNDALENT